jgi:hypothetical protein
MSKGKINWLIFNFVIIILSVIFENTVFGGFSLILYLVSVLSIAFLYDSFLATFKDFLKKKVAFKALYKEYSKFEIPTSITLKIFLQMFFGIKFVLDPLLKYKFEFINIYQHFVDYLGLVLGAILIVFMFKNIIKFNR